MDGRGAGARVIGSTSCAVCWRPRYGGSPWCPRHRARYYRYGSPTGRPQPRRKNLAGRRFGALLAVDYDSIARKWRCICDCGLETGVRAWSLTSGGTTSCGRRARHVDPKSYEQMHSYLRRHRGPATQYRCAKCGASAQQWSYLRRTARVRVESPSGPWSPLVEDYQAMCTPCHKRDDLWAIAAEERDRHGHVPLW